MARFEEQQGGQNRFIAMRGRAVRTEERPLAGQDARVELVVGMFLRPRGGFVIEALPFVTRKGGQPAAKDNHEGVHGFVGLFECASRLADHRVGELEKFGAGFVFCAAAPGRPRRTLAPGEFKD
ncbi:MAG TPA: hypothetical protein VG710_08160 [Opitutus sp.]|nr:hypothetical protein [Opitutus sp.]